MKTIIFMPIKLNNERTSGKNLKCFDEVKQGNKRKGGGKK